MPVKEKKKKKKPPRNAGASAAKDTGARNNSIANAKSTVAQVLRIGKASCPTHQAVMSLQHRDDTTSRNVTGQTLSLVYLLEIPLPLRRIRA